MAWFTTISCLSSVLKIISRIVVLLILRRIIKSFEAWPLLTEFHRMGSQIVICFFCTLV